MIRKISAILAACAFAFTTLAAAAADARDYRRDGYYRDYGGRHHHRRHDDDGDAVAAGVVGLVLGLAIGSLASQPREPGPRCYDNYQRCAPPPPPRYQDQGYYGDPRYSNQGYADPRYAGSAYADDYGLEGGSAPQGSYDPYYDQRQPQCTRRERQWDRYANRYVTVDVPC